MGLYGGLFYKIKYDIQEFWHNNSYNTYYYY